MEVRFDRAAAAIAELSVALEKYASVQADITELQRYMDSGDWRRDFEADEAGRLPANLKRGVLAEDGLWNLLAEHQDVLQHIENLSNRKID